MNGFKIVQEDVLAEAPFTIHPSIDLCGKMFVGRLAKWSTDRAYVMMATADGTLYSLWDGSIFSHGTQGAVCVYANTDITISVESPGIAINTGP